MEQYKVEIEMLNEVVQNKPHPISGKDKINWDDVPDSTQLEMRGHLTEKKTYALPLTYFNGCISNFFVEFCPWGNDGIFSSKDKRKSYISSKLRVIPYNGEDYIDTGITNINKEFGIKKIPIDVNNKGSSSLSNPTQPILKLKGRKYILHVLSAVDDRPKEDIAALINDAGLMCGIGSWRRSGGKGRFKVTGIDKLSKT